MLAPSARSLERQRRRMNYSWSTASTAESATLPPGQQPHKGRRGSQLYSDSSRRRTLRRQTCDQHSHHHVAYVAPVDRVFWWRGWILLCTNNFHLNLCRPSRPQEVLRRWRSGDGNRWRMPLGVSSYDSARRRLTGDGRSVNNRDRLAVRILRGRLSRPFQDQRCSPQSGEGAIKGALNIAYPT